MIRAPRIAARSLAILTCALPFGLFGVPAPAAAQELDAQEVAETRAELEELAALERRVRSIGWRIVTGNAAFCRLPVKATGLALIDSAQFRRPGLIQAALDLQTPIAVLTAAEGSPAAALDPFTGIAALDGVPVERPTATPRSDWYRIRQVYDLLARSAQDGSVRVTTTAGEDHDIAAVPACNAQIDFNDLHDNLASDGRLVLVGKRFPGLAYADDELAGALAHEYAHVLLNHTATRRSAALRRSDIRGQERLADRLAVWLIANAGYDPAAMARFMARWGPRHGGGLARKRTHDGWDERLEAIEAEVAVVRAAIDQTLLAGGDSSAASAEADWRGRFPYAAMPRADDPAERAAGAD